MDSLSKISRYHADAIKTELDKKRFGINSCKCPQDYALYRRLMKVLKYYQVNKDMALASVVYLGETKDAYYIKQEIENCYCPAINKFIKAL